MRQHAQGMKVMGAGFQLALAASLVTLSGAHASDSSGDDARWATEAREDTWWTGRPGEAEWRWSAAFVRPVHLGVVRAHFGMSPTSGVPTEFHWEVRSPAPWADT